MRRIGLLGGSFDPIHFGHLNLALQLLESKQLTQVLFCPASLSPFKKRAPPCAAKEHRLHMVQLAIAPIAGFALLDWEVHRSEACYTIDTVRRLVKEAQEETQFHLLLGEDAFRQLHAWKESEALVQLAPPLVGARSSSTTLQEQMVPIHALDISSTDIRERLQKHLYCGHLVPAKVLDYIFLHRLYFELPDG